MTQYAHQVGTIYTSVPAKTVHGMLPKAVFHPDAARAISAHLLSISGSIQTWSGMRGRF